MTDYFGPLRFMAGSDTTSVVDPRFGTGAIPTQPTGWGGTGGGGSSTYEGGVRGFGFHIPPGSIDRLTAGLANHASQRVEVSWVGSSSSAGSGPDAGQGGPVRAFRDIMHGAGLTDGGRGLLRPVVEAYDSNHRIVSQSGFDAAGASYDYPFGTSASVTDGATITYSGVGTAVRLVGRSASGLSYTIDGGSPVTIPDEGGAWFRAYSGGLAPGVHQVTVTKSGTTRTLVGIEFINDAGVIVHQDARSGAVTETYADSTTITLGESPASVAGFAKLSLGLDIPPSGTPRWMTSPSSLRPNAARNTVAAVWAVGLNDTSAVTDVDPIGEGAYVASKIAENTAEFIRLTRAAGADPIITIPHLSFYPGAHRSAGRVRAAMVSVAESHNAAWVDWDIALALAGWPYGSQSHLSQTQSEAVAQFMFDTVFTHAMPV